MSKKLLVTVVLLAAAAIGAFYLTANRTPANREETEGQAVAPVPPPEEAAGVQTTNEVPPATFTVSMNTGGFSPPNLTIKAGDTVTFKNNDTRQRWPASGLHPTHLICAGFDALEPVPPGKSYSHAFAAAGECPLHDHLIPRLQGKITATE